MRTPEGVPSLQSEHARRTQAMHLQIRGRRAVSCARNKQVRCLRETTTDDGSAGKTTARANHAFCDQCGPSRSTVGHFELVGDYKHRNVS